MSKKDKLLASAQKSLQKGQLGKAIKDYEKIVQQDPKDIRSRQKLAEILGRDNKIAAALEEYETVAKHYAGGGFYLKAIAVYKQMQRLDGGQADYYHRLAELNEKQGLVGNALAEYRNLVAHYEKQEMLSEALGVLQKMKELEPENLNVLVKIAETCARRGDHEEARQEFDSALTMLRDKGDHGRVLKLYEIFLPLYPDDEEMKVGLTQALVAQGDADKGIELLQRLLKDHTEQREILHSLAEGYRKAEDYENERLMYLHFLHHSPDDLQLREGVIRASLDAGEDQRAREEIDEWQESFRAAGKSGIIQDFDHRLDSKETAGDDSPSIVSGAAPVIAGGNSQSRTAEAMEVDPEEHGRAWTEPFLDDSLLQDPGPGSPAEKKPSEDAGGIEEIPLEFLEAVEQDTGEDMPPESSGEPVPEPEPAAAKGKKEPEQKGAEGETLSEDVELELELDIDEVDGFEFDLNDRFEAEGTSDPVDHGESGEDQVPDEFEEIEELEELEDDELEEIEEVVAEGETADSTVSIKDLLPSETASDFPDLDEDRIDFADSQKGVETEIDGEDSESHYNLGIAYKEMGLLEDAVAEFDKAMRNPARKVDCLTLKGACLVESGAYEAGEEVFRAALDSELSDSERISLHYELGLLYEDRGRPLEALDSFQHVADADIFFRDVGKKIEDLRRELGMEDDRDDEAGGKGSRNRVSYV